MHKFNTKVFLKDLESQSLSSAENDKKNTKSKNEDSLIENVRKNENLAEYCILEGISDEKCKDPQKETQSCYVNSCKHCCYITIGGSNACLQKCESMKKLLKI